MEQTNGSDYLARTNNGTSFSGSDMNIVASLMIASAIELWAKHGIMPTRGMTVTQMLKRASDYTHKKYSNRKKESMLQAVADLRFVANQAKILPKAEVNPWKGGGE